MDGAVLQLLLDVRDVHLDLFFLPPPGPSQEPHREALQAIQKVGQIEQADFLLQEANKGHVSQSSPQPNFSTPLFPPRLLFKHRQKLA